MRVVREGKHECELPYVFQYTRGAIVECDCGRQWKASHPGNPEYSCWKSPLLGNRYWVRGRRMMSGSDRRREAA